MAEEPSDWSTSVTFKEFEVNLEGREDKKPRPYSVTFAAEIDDWVASAIVEREGKKLVIRAVVRRLIKDGLVATRRAGTLRVANRIGRRVTGTWYFGEL